MFPDGTVIRGLDLGGVYHEYDSRMSRLTEAWMGTRMTKGAVIDSIVDLLEQDRVSDARDRARSIRTDILVESTGSR